MCKLVIVGNNKPQMGEVDPAIARRLRLIEFTQRPVKVDEELKDKMSSEYSMILQWMIEGFQMYMKDGLKPPECVLKASNAYLASEDVISSFLKSCITKTIAGDNFVTRQDINDLITIWR